MNNKESFTSKAISIIGSQDEMAKELGVVQSSVHRWKVKDRFPAEYVLRIEKLTGISRHDLRPDIYPREA